LNGSSFLQTQSTLKTPPSAFAERPGGKTHDMGGTSLRDSQSSRATPANFPLSLTEKINRTLRDSLNAWFNFASFCGGVDHTPFAFDNVTFSALLLLITKKRASRNK
jgi:hypothetical protein